jgi:hypothetical protein
MSSDSMKKIEDVIEGLQFLKKSSTLADNIPIISRGETVYTISEVIEILESNKDDNLRDTVLEGLGEINSSKKS